MKFKLSIISLPPERHSALGPFFALCSQAASSSVLTCRFLPYSSCRSLLLCGLAVDSLGRGWSCYPLWISRILLFFCLMPGLTSSRPQVLKAGTMPSSPGSSCQPSAASTLFLDPSAFHIPVWAPPQAHSPRRGDSFILIKSSWLRLPHCYLDMWSLTLPSVSSQQGNTSQNLPSTGSQYKVTFHFRNESYYHGLNV